jgi:hypothetical protein
MNFGKVRHGYINLCCFGGSEHRNAIRWRDDVGLSDNKVERLAYFAKKGGGRQARR